MNLSKALLGDADNWIPQLIASPIPGARDVACVLLASEQYWGKLWRQRLLALVDDPDWEVREWAVYPLVAMVRHRSEEGMHQLNHWAQTVNISTGLKRAIVVAIRELSQSRHYSPEILLAILDRIVAEEAAYVRKNLGPFYHDIPKTRCVG